MAFTVKTTVDDEDGNSMTTIEFADAYFLERGVTAWTGVEAVKQAAMIRSNDYLEMRFGQRWTEETLELEEVPVKVQRAACEYALRALTAVLAPDPVLDASGASVVTIRKKLGPLEKQLQVMGSGKISLIRSYPAADLLIAPYVNPSQTRAYR